jgi:phosphonopyruvate decarboxylase
VVLDGDGATIMHTGALAIIGQKQPSNFVHVVINNGAHETVGGMPNASGIIDYAALAISMGYRNTFSAKDEDELTVVIPRVLAAEGPVLLEVRTALGARSNLGRPTTSAYSNGREFMDFLIERVL